MSPFSSGLQQKPPAQRRRRRPPDLAGSQQGMKEPPEAIPWLSLRESPGLFPTPRSLLASTFRTPLQKIPSGRSLPSWQLRNRGTGRLILEQLSGCVQVSGGCPLVALHVEAGKMRLAKDQGASMLNSHVWVELPIWNPLGLCCWNWSGRTKKFYEVRFRPRVRHVGATAQPRPPAAGAEGDGVLHVPWSSGLRRFWGTRFGGSHETHTP